MIIGIQTEESERAKEFFIKTDDKLRSPEFTKNPFLNSKVFFFPDNIYILRINPIYPNLSIVFILLTIATYLFKLYNVSIIFSIILGIFIFLFSNLFYRLVISLGLRKAGYRGSKDFLYKESIINYLLRGKK